MIVNLLERFGGYTYASLMKEDASFIRTVRLADTAREVEQGRGDDDYDS